ncbi:pck [Cordylochernes scorpioides]|uniref:Pck n=1 Tax=Cordylochernes scorpioides TaxID=51811 RepID=A0ABY6L9D6_9ARAC|nr:pck [Cordylochernes scorpioides]
MSEEGTVSAPRHPLSRVFLTGALAGFCGTVFLVVAVASPYWLKSYPKTYSEFKHLGLWEACFSNYHHPKYQYDSTFDGCHGFLSQRFMNLREWLQPGWFIFVQAMMVLALLFSLSSLVLVGLLMMRYLLQYELLMMAAILCLTSLAALPTLFAVSVFGALAFDRSWIQYPNFNHLSWSYALAVVSFFMHLISAGLLLRETCSARDRHRRYNSYLYNVGQPFKPEIFRFEQGPYRHTTEAL